MFNNDHGVIGSIGERSIRFLSYIFLIDASTSMTETDWPPSRLDAGVAACCASVDILRADKPDSHIAVIGYSEKAFVICPWTPVRILRSSEQLHSAWLVVCESCGLGNTNITAALEQAVALMTESHPPTQVVLLSDGHHNTGPDPFLIGEQLKARAAVATVGIGGTPADVDGTMLTTLASPQNGGTPSYRWIGDRGRLIAHFEKLAGGICCS